MTHPTIERKYALTKIAPGDYLLPSNDGKAIWRIAKQIEGPSSGITDWPADKEVWGLWRWEKPIVMGESVIEVENWDRWEFFEGPHMTRGEAIDSALRFGLPHPSPAKLLAEAK